tara:strand:- start:191 stop:487 length:297 start_codon:yes stop_codon:yes gene_type:complete
MHPDYKAVSTEIPVNDPEKMAQFQELMNQGQDLLVEHIKELGGELGLSYSDASSIYYLRTRSRWTQELEDRLIQANRAGHSIPTTDGGEAERLAELGF